MIESPAPQVSVVIPTRNGGEAWRRTLDALLGQDLEVPFELIVLDTASTDGTPELAEQRFRSAASNPRRIPLRLERITPQQFGHGRTRNLGARLARGEIVVFLSQDATPVGSHWLAALVTPFADGQTVGAFCRQVALPGIRLPERFILETTYPPRSSMRTRDSLASRDAGYILFSNAASAIRREALLATPFDEAVMMCEDTHWAVRVLEAGRRIAYVADATVAHSHNYTLRAIFSRNFDYAVALEGLPGSMGLRSYLHYLRREVAFLARHNGIVAMPWTAAFEAARCLGYVLGARQRRLPTWLVRRISGYPQWFAREGSTARTAENPGEPVLRGGTRGQ